MTIGLRHWRVWCVTESASVFKWAEDAPTDCPNNPAHTITADKTAAVNLRQALQFIIDPLLESVTSGISRVVANDRPAIECPAGITGFAAAYGVWPHDLNDAAVCRVTAAFILKESGTGTKVRIAAKVKADSEGDDTSGAFADSAFSVATVSHTTIGEQFVAAVDLDASTFAAGDAVALHVGRDGDNGMGAGTDDDVDVAVELIALKVEAL